MTTKGVVVAGLAGGSGKSVVSVGLTAYFTDLGLNVAPFKKGPDYIDAGWMALAARRSCYNLDPYLMSDEVIKNSFAKHVKGVDIAVIEGNRGLYDGVNAKGGYSTAELALLLDLPVILVVNCTKTTRTVAAMVLGCQMLDKRVDIRGVVLNQIATKRQKKIVTEAVESETGLPVLGVVPRMRRDIFPMRHLGMLPHQEYQDSDGAISFLVDTIKDEVDISKVQQVLEDIDVADNQEESEALGEIDTQKVRIGIIQDAAFQFYYAENLEALEAQGAEIISVNALEDKSLPPGLDGLYIGGGFPETSAGKLAANESFRKSVKEAADNGLPIYAECGGLIYLGQSIELDGNEYRLTGVFPARFGMSRKPQAHGYSIFNVVGPNPFYERNTQVKGHEFRYSTVLHWGGKDEDMALKMERGTGFWNGRDGLRYNNVLALYTHIHAGGTPEWAKGFVSFCKKRANKSG